MLVPGGALGMPKIAIPSEVLGRAPVTHSQLNGWTDRKQNTRQADRHKDIAVIANKNCRCADNLIEKGPAAGGEAL